MTKNRESHIILLLRKFGGLFHFLLSSIALFALAYLLGHSILHGQIKGNDSPLHIGYALWLNQFFPNIPHWYPLQGGGESLLHGYPIASHFLVIIVSRLGGLSIFQAFRLIIFVSFPLTAIGIYLFTWQALKRQTVGLIAGVLYLLAPLSWTMTYDWGFLAQSTAMIFLPLGLICFDRYLNYRLEFPKAGRRQLWLCLSVLLLVITIMTHIVVGAGIIGAMILISLVSKIAAQPSERSRYLSEGIRAIFYIGSIAGLILLVYIIPFYRYGLVANREGLNLGSLHQMNRLPLAEFLGLKASNPRYILTRMANPLVSTLFFVLGFLFALRYSRKAFVLGIVTILASIYSLVPELSYLLRKVSTSLAMVFGLRSMLVVVMVLLPVCAGFGFWAIAMTIVSPRKFLRKDASSRANGKNEPNGLTNALVSGLALIIAGFAIVTLGTVFVMNTSHLSYGPLSSGIDIGDIWDLGGDLRAESIVEQLQFENWPQFKLSGSDNPIERSQQLGVLLPQERPLRIDISPYLGRFAMDVVAYTDVSQINTYTFQISLIHAMWGYQQNVFFSLDSGVGEYGNVTTLNNTAKWFGTKYVLLNPSQDPIEMYEEAGWKRESRDNELEIWRFPEAPDMATFTTRPVILIIGKPETDAYMTIFRLANDGMLPYEEAILVEGKPRVDSYSLEELRPFDAVFLYGYDYKNSRKAWDIISAYVEGGGSLFVDTGWEFWIPEWEFEQAPAVFPINRLVWTDYGMAENFELGSDNIAGEVDIGQFKPLIWEGQPWTLSGAEMSDIRDWGRVVLSAAGKPLIVAGEYGQGRVVWSGMNLISHARYLGENEEELLLVHNILNWLVGYKERTEITDYAIMRDYPDQVNLSAKISPDEVTWLYWREAYYSNWHAYVTQTSEVEEMPIYRAGPGFMLMPINTTSEEVSVQLKWVPPFIEKAAAIVSIMGLLLVGALILDGLLLDGNGFTWAKIALTIWLPKPILDEETHTKNSKQELKDDHKTHAEQMGKEHRELSIDIQMDFKHKKLFKEWLEDSGSEDDGWVAKVLGSGTNK